MKLVTFFVKRWSDGYYVASAQEVSIVTQGKTLDELVKNIDEAVSLSFEEDPVVSPYTVIFNSNIHVAEV